MKLGRLSAILDAYGAAPERWPAAEREEALALVRSSVPAARALAQAEAFDKVLNHAAIPELAPNSQRFTALHATIVSRVRPRQASWFTRWLGVDLTPSQLWPSLAGLTVATVLGFAVGLGGLIQADTDHESEEVSMLSPFDLSVGQ